ncbi:MAG: CHASE3 domain-containing protein [Chitinophagaceae bacterium]|nr:CHASE3 domain-containing protein [Chitinophagaceae bacterium]
MFAKLKIAADKIFVIVIAILFLTIIVALIASVSHFRQVSESAKMVAHAQDVIIQAEELSALVIDNETLSRGYAITGKKNW